MRAAAAAERSRVERELARLTAREQGLADDLARARSVREELEGELLVLHRFAEDPEPQDLGATPAEPHLHVVAPGAAPDSESAAVTLKGARIRETAVRVLAQTPHADQAVHYRAWFELLRQQGFMPAGKDPLASFLTQIGRSPLVQRTTSAGKYTLDLEFPGRARARLAQLRDELQVAQDLPPDAGVDSITEARERRSALTSELEATERTLEEALRSLGEAAA